MHCSCYVTPSDDSRWMEYDFGISYGDDIEQAKRLMLETIHSIDDILRDPAPDVLLLELAESSVNIRARWWIKPPRQIDDLISRNKVISAIKRKLSENGIDLPYPTRQILFHDQTEETDGDRARQREGWPAGNKEVPKPRSISGSLKQLAEIRASKNGNDTSILAITMLTLDRQGYYGPLENWGWIYTGSTDGARAMLFTIAGSMITVAGTVFSITIVALQLAASNFGPRLLRNFMHDIGNQVVLGTFIGTFIYCLLVLRTVRGEGDDYDIFIPQMSVTFALALAFVSISLLIYFIHHASTIIQASHVTSEVSTELSSATDRLFPEKFGHSLSGSGRQVAEIPANFD